LRVTLSSNDQSVSRASSLPAGFTTPQFRSISSAIVRRHSPQWIAVPCMLNPLFSVGCRLRLLRVRVFVETRYFLPGFLGRCFLDTDLIINFRFCPGSILTFARSFATAINPRTSGSSNTPAVVNRNPRTSFPSP
jgi:hypothetical protein